MYWHTERYCKIALIKNTKSYDSIIIGNSRAAWISPDNDRTLNLAFSGARYHEIYKFLEKYLENDKTVFIGLDFEDFYAGDRDGKTFVSKKLPEYIHHLFSFEISGASYANHFHRDEFLPSIQISEKGNRVMIESDWKKLADLNQMIEEQEFAQSEYTNTAVPNSINEKEAIDILKKIKNLLMSRDTKYVVFTHPILPATKEKLLRKHPQQIKLIQQFSDELKKIFPEAIEYALDHAFPNSLYRDPEHYSPEIGEKILQELRARIDFQFSK